VVSPLVAIVVALFAVPQLVAVATVFLWRRRLRRRGAIPDFISRLVNALLLVALLAIAWGAIDLLDSVGEMDIFGVSAARKEEILGTGLGQVVLWTAATLPISGFAALALWFVGVKRFKLARARA